MKRGGRRLPGGVVTGEGKGEHAGRRNYRPVLWRSSQRRDVAYPVQSVAINLTY